jgi:hypothetical protein
VSGRLRNADLAQALRRLTALGMQVTRIVFLASFVPEAADS